MNHPRLTRRSLLQRAAAASLLTTLPAWMPRLTFAAPQTAPRGDTLVVIFLRGAADVLNMIVPHGEERYYNRRPTLAIARPDDRTVETKLRTLDLDGFFGLHPALQPLVAAWQAKHLAIVHACGAPDVSRSHFQAMELMERGVEKQSGPASGWIGRHLATHPTGNLSPLRAVGFANPLPRSLRGPIPASALKSIADFHLGGDQQSMVAMQQALSALYTNDPALNHDDSLRQIGQGTLDVMSLLGKLQPDSYRPSRGAIYPSSDFGKALQQIALLIKAEAGLEVAAVDVGGWDTHFVQGGSQGQMAKLLSDLGQGLAALHEDLFDYAAKLSVVVMSEFGRRLQENGSFGTDHGHGSAMLLVGGNVAGGKVHGRWPGLADEQLVGPGDLAVTTDYRNVLGELCFKRLGNTNLQEVFPEYRVQIPGVFKA
ncbi:MAG: DUF1501 domain-containing protein [Caldilineaceae bacterium]